MNKLIIILPMVILFSCTGKKQEMTETELTRQGDIISFNSEQSRLASVETGKIEVVPFSRKLVCSGNIESTPDGRALLTPPMGGFIKNINHYIGQKIKKYEVLAILENPEYIQLQEDFLVRKSRLEYIQSEFKRKESLYAEKAVSEKEFLQAKSDLMVLNAELSSVKARLEMIGINPEKIEGSDLKTTISVVSPINGYIADITGNVGKYCSETDVIIEVVDPDNMHLHLKVFEKDISRIKVGQAVVFSSLSEPKKKYKANIFSLGHSVSKNDLAITVHATIKNRDENLIPGLFVNAEIQTFTEELFAIPREGVIPGKEVSYIFIVTDDGFQRIPVRTGLENEQYISLVDPDDNILNSEIVINGAYFINAALEASVEE